MDTEVFEVQEVRPSASALLARLRKQRRPVVNWDVEETILETVDDDESRPGHYKLSDLGEKMCKFATTPYDAASHFFCGEPTDETGVWCAEHHAVCYTPVKAPVFLNKRV